MTDRIETGWWSRAALIVVRLALVVFLLWALVSARNTTDAPTAIRPPGASSSPPGPGDRMPVEVG